MASAIETSKEDSLSIGAAEKTCFKKEYYPTNEDRSSNDKS